MKTTVEAEFLAEEWHPVSTKAANSIDNVAVRATLWRRDTVVNSTLGGAIFGPLTILKQSVTWTIKASYNSHAAFASFRAEARRRTSVCDRDLSNSSNLEEILVDL